MEFTFVCPQTRRPFTTLEFVITDNRGVQTDSAGNRHLDAKVKLVRPCPHCGRRHIYHAGEIACPFGGPENRKPENMDS